MKRIVQFFTSSIHRRILSSFAAVIVLVLGMTVAGYFQLGQVRGSADQAIPNARQMGLVQDLALALSSLDADLERFFVIGGAQYRENVLQDLEKMESTLQSMRQNESAESSPTLDKLEKATSAVQGQIRALLEMATTDSTGRQTNEKIIALYSEIDQIKQMHQQISEETVQELQTTAQQQKNTASNVILQFIVLGGLVTLIVLSASLAVTRSIATPLGNLAETARQIAAGHLEQAALVERQDEIGTLARSFNSMTTQLRDLISSLETRVQARTAQLTAGAQVARVTSSILNPQELLQATVDLIRERFGYYYAAVFLLDQDSHSAVLRAGTGEAGQTMLGHGHKFEVGSQSMVGWVCVNWKARIALDVGQDAVRFANPLLPDTRSEIALPLQAGGRILGVLDVQSERPAAFDDNDIAVLQGMADQIAVALDNARLFTQTQTALSENERLLSQVETALHEATALYEASQAISAASDNTAVSQAVVDHVLKPDIDLCLFVLFEAYESGLPQALDISHVWARGGQLGRQGAETLVGSHFEVAQFPLREFLHADQPQVIRSRAQLPINVATQKLWERLGVQALALIPLNAGGRWVGALCLGAAGEAAFVPGALRSYQAAANQVAITVENRRLYQDAQTSLREVSALYRSFTREAWERTLQARPTLSEYDYVAIPGAAEPGTRVESHDGSDMRVPLRLRDQDIGYLELAGSEQTWTEQTRTLVETVSAQVALALESARLFEQTQDTLADTRALYQASARINSATTIDEILAALRDHTVLGQADVFTALNVFDTPWTDGRMPRWLDVAARWTPQPAESLASRYDLAQYPAIHSLRASEPLVINDIESDPRLDESARQSHRQAFQGRSAVIIPLVVGELWIGFVDAVWSQPAEYASSDLQRLMSLAGQASAAIQTRRLFDQTRARVQQLAVLNEISRTASGMLDSERLYETIYEQIQHIMDVDAFFISLYDASERSLTFPLCYDRGQRYELAAQSLLPESRSYHAITSGQARLELLTPEQRQLEEASVAPNQRLGDATNLAASLMFAPLKVGERVTGVISAQSYEYNAYSQEDLDLFANIASQVAVATENARLFEQTQTRVRQLAVLNEISRAASSVMETERLFGTLYEQIQHIMDVGAFYVGLYDSASNVITYPVFYDEAQQYDEADEVLQPGTRTHRVITSGEPLLIALTPAEHVQESRQVSHAMGNVSKASATLAYAPLKIGDRVTGLLSVQSYKFEAFTQEHMNLLSGIANQVAVAVENARLFKEARARALQLATASEAGRAATSILDLDELLWSTVDLVRVRFGYSQASIFLLDKTGQFAVLRETTSDAGKRLIQNNYQLSVGGQSLIGWVTSMGRSRVVRETDTDTLFIKDSRWPTAQSELAIPLKRGDQVIGALGVQSNELHTFRADEVTVLELLADQISIAIQNARLYGQTREQSVVLEKRAADLAAVNEVSRLVTQTLDQNEILNTAARVLVSHFDVGHAAIALLTPSRTALRIAAERPDQGTLGMEIPLTGAQVAREYLDSKTAFAVDDVMTDPRMELLRQGMLRFSVRSAMFLPLVIQGESVGFIRIDAIGVTRRFSEEELSLGHTLASQVAVALQNARLFEETRRRAKEVQQLYEIGGQLNSTLELRPVMQLVADAARELVGSDEGLVFVQRGTELYESRMSPARTETNPPDPGGLTETIMRTGRLIYIPDITTDPRSSPDLYARGVRSQIGLPIRIGNRTIGVLFANSNAPNDLDQHAQELLSFLSAQAATAIQNSLLYEEQKETAEKLREVDRLKTEFLASMSHELRTPLNSIIGFSRVILKGIDGPLSDLQKQDLEAIHGSGQHLLGLINNILDISKIEAGKMELAFEEVDMKQTIKTVMSTAIGLNKGKPVELKTDIPEDLPMVWADQTRSRQVLLNLVSNASKFTEQGSITCTATYDHQCVTVGVRDTGIGIPSDKLGMIFDEFTQVDASTTRKYGGTGLGLAISRRFVEMHGGKIWVESEEDHGATFYFTLPRAQVATPPQEEPQKQAQRVLLAVDDDPGVITLYKRYLEKQGYQVIGVTDSRQAVEQAIRLKPDVITVDILMPNKDGWSVIQELRHTPETKDIPVVVCSITSDQGKGFSLGAADYLVKPITEDDLRVALKRLDGRNQSNVLIIDDTPEDIRLIRRILEAPRTPGDQRLAYLIHEASNGALGIEAVHQNPPDLIILDLMMPEVDGFAVLGALKADPRTRHIPIVVVTAKTLTEQDHQRLNGHIEALLSKGLFSERELMEHVAMALSKVMEAKRSD